MDSASRATDLEGTFNSIYDFRFTPDFAGGRTFILDAFVAARLKPWAVVTAGKFKVPVGLERLVSANDLRFIERAFPTSLVPNRDLGMQLGGDIAGGVVNYSVGYFNGVSDGGSSDGNTPTPDAENDTKGDWAARVFFQPFLNSDNFALRGLGFGVAGTYVTFDRQHHHDVVAGLSHARAANILQLSRHDRGERYDAGSERHDCGRRATALDTAGLLLDRQLRRAR